MLLGWLQNSERAHEALIDGHHCARIIELATIIGRREDGHELPVGEELVAVLDDLVRTHDQIKVVLLQKFADDVGAKSVRDAAIVLRPTRNIGLGVEFAQKKHSKVVRKKVQC